MPYHVSYDYYKLITTKNTLRTSYFYRKSVSSPSGVLVRALTSNAFQTR